MKLWPGFTGSTLDQTYILCHSPEIVYKLLAALIRSESLRRALGFEQTIWTRKVQDLETRKLVQQLNPTTLNVLEISGHLWADQPFKSYRSVQFPEFDICRDTLADRFDLIIAEHILEHVLQPEAAVKNIHRMLVDGGHALIVTPFLYRVHPAPIDMMRWTVEGLKRLLSDYGFDRFLTGSWGNRDCVKATLTREFRLFNRYLHSLKDEPEYPIVVWALAQKVKSGEVNGRIGSL